MSKPVIICVHGLRNKPGIDNLQHLWNTAISDGLQRNQKFERFDDTIVEMAYWADIMYPHPDEDRDYPACSFEGPVPGYDDGFWDDIRANASDLVGPVVETAKLWLGIDALTEALLEQTFLDLHRYYTDPAIQTAVRNRLRDRLILHRDRRIMVIGHSMGSIVAYDVLRKLGREVHDLHIDHFITIGSPLGLPHVKVQLARENSLVRTPTVVQRWSNFSERRDPVALDTHLGRDFDVNDQGVRVVDDLVLNNNVIGKDGKIDYHSEVGYLRAPEVSHVIRRFL